MRPFKGWFSKQNLADEDKERNTLRGWLKHGRMFYYPPDGEDYGHISGIEWHTGGDWKFGARFEIEAPYAGDDDYKGSIHFGPFSLYINAETSNVVRKHKFDTQGGVKMRCREYGFEISRMLGIRFMFGRDPWNWSREDPWYGEIVFHPIDTVLGRHIYNSERISTTRQVVSLPEGDYPATVEFNRDTWVRKHFPFKPFKQEILRANVEPDIPIPVPGKGENSWDIGDDAYHDSYGPANNPQDACERMANSVMDTRTRYASADWIPDAGWKVGNNG